MPNDYDIEFRLEVNLVNTVKSQEDLDALVSKVKAAVLQASTEVCKFQPTGLDIRYSVNYPMGTYLLGRGRVR